MIPAATIAKWRHAAIAVVTSMMPSTESQREIAWRFLKQWGAT